MRLDNKWEFVYHWSDDFMKYFIDGEQVRLPHNVGEIPLHYADPEIYNTVCGYRRVLVIPKEVIGSKIFLQFDGAAHVAEIFLNQRLVGTHYGGYTSFRVDISDYVRKGKNYLAVRLDCRENPEIPPFGPGVDGLTYGGLYRDVWMDIRPHTYIKNVFVSTIDRNTIHVDVTTEGNPMITDVEIYSPNGSLVATAKDCRESTDIHISRPKLWSPEHPNLYRCVVTIKNEDYIDTQEVTFGMRVAEFREDGFYLNGNKTFIRGLNRHQSYPCIGNALPEHLQREDARILKEELCVNAVRAAHYPPSPFFLDACDREGIMVFAELPGCRHIGEEAWKKHALDYLKDLILQNRNHPSIILWGVRISDSEDDDDFYTQTNALAHELDPSRATAGVRDQEKSHLLEDVYAYNDYSHDGTNVGCRPKHKVTPDTDKAYLISGSNGPMFPTKSCDDWEHRQEQALRHARVLDAAMANEDIAGCFQCSMTDYATHKEFGSGDRVCYHGVLDAFRNPKPAAAVYAGEGGSEPVLEVGSSFDSGDYSSGGKGTVYAFTNAEEVRLYKNDAFVKAFAAGEWDALQHGPVAMDDMIGNLLETQEGFDSSKAEFLHDLLLSAERNGLQPMSAFAKTRIRFAMLKYGLTHADLSALYRKYVSGWVAEPARWRVDAIRGGEVVKSRILTPGTRLHIEAKASQFSLMEGETYDMALVRIRILDENDNLASYAQFPIILATEGVIHVVGPKVITAEGGMCGCLVRTDGWSGEGKLTVYTESGLETSVDFVVYLEE